MLKPGDIAIVSGARTPFGRYCGKLKDFTAQELGALAARGAIERAGVDPKEIDHAVFGNAQQTSGDALYGARHVGLRAGLPIETPALTVHRQCRSLNRQASPQPYVPRPIQGIARSLLRVAEHSMIDLLRIDTGPLNRAARRKRPQFLRGEVLQLAAIAAEGRP